MSAVYNNVAYPVIQVNGQRFIGPPKELTNMEPSYNFELFVKNLPRNWYESELLAYFSSAGFVYQIRLLMEYSGRNRGIAFVRYTSQEDFNQSLKM